MIGFIQETVHTIISTPRESLAESTIINAVQWLRLIVETTGAIIIGMGVVAAAYQFVRALIPPQLESYNSIRLTLARYLALALEFQLGADILSTAVAPSWDQIGKLGAIAVIRTGLNYFLTREMREERGKEGESKKVKGKSVDESL
jgi:uncharacterized membrane protein